MRNTHLSTTATNGAPAATRSSRPPTSEVVDYRDTPRVLLEPRRLAGALLRTARPRHWTKNLLVLAAPAAAGVLHRPDAAARIAVTLVAFCLAASATYFANDLRDRHSDRLHPTKRHRPIAAGVVSPNLARAVVLVLVTAALALSTAATPFVSLVLGGYLALTTAYSVRLKHAPILDIGAISVGFLLRAVAGAVTVDVPVSSWFLIVVSFGALLVASGKRYAEAHNLGTERANGHRRALAGYTTTFLRHVVFSAATVAILGYCSWALDAEGAGGNLPLTLSILPFVLAILHYALQLENGGGEQPEELALRDRTMQFFGATWVALITIGVYVS